MPHRVFSVRPFLPIAIAAAIVVAFGTSGSATAQENKGPGDDAPTMKVAVDAVRSEPLSQTVPVIGRFVARQTGVVATRVAGLIKEFRAEVGDRVNAGDVVTILVNDRLKWRHSLQQAEVTNYAAQLDTKKAEIKLRRQELERLKSLRKSPAFSQARLDDKRQEVLIAESEAVEAEAKLRVARADLQLTGIDLKDAEVRAPYTGTVTQRHTEVGSYIDVGDPVVTLIDDTSLEIEADVPANRIGGLSPGKEIVARLDDGHTLSAWVRAAIPEENSQTRTRAVRFTPDLAGAGAVNGSAVVATNQSVTLRIPAGAARQVVTVHKDAILDRTGGKLVVVADGGQSRFQPVVLGEAAGSRLVVLQGLKVGDLVVVRGNERLIPGQKIEFDAPPTGDEGGKS